METIGHPDDGDRDGEQLVAEYLAELEREAARLPWIARNELLEDVRSHIEVAISEVEGTAQPSEETSTSENPAPGSATSRAAQIRRILAALGEPREIVAAAAVEEPSSATSLDVGLPQPLTRREQATILLLLFGALLFGFGWLAGVMLLWTSPRWKLRERLLGTLIWPGGLFVVFLLIGLPTKTESCAGSSLDPVQHCTSSGWSLPSALAIPILLLAFLAPVGMARFLARTARNRPGAELGKGGAGGLFATIAVAFGVLLLVVAAGAVVAVGGSAKQGGPGGGAVGPAELPVQSPVYSSSAAPVSSSSG